MDETYNVAEAIAAQKAYCEKTGAPRFAPYDGVCYSCHQQIYAGEIVKAGHIRYHSGYSVEYAASHLVTGCPYCYASYVD